MTDNVKDFTGDMVRLTPDYLIRYYQQLANNDEIDFIVVSAVFKDRSLPPRISVSDEASPYFLSFLSGALMEIALGKPSARVAPASPRGH